MQAFRLLTNCANEVDNDTFASKVVERFKSSMDKVEVTFISDSLGTTFFVRRDEKERMPLQYYYVALQLLDAIVKAVYGPLVIVDELRLI